MSKVLPPAEWTKKGKEQWERSSNAFERYVYSASENGLIRYGIKVTIQAKPHVSIAQAELSKTLRSAWLSTLYQVPNVTIRPCLIEGTQYYMSYNQAAPSQQEADAWLDETITERIVSEVQQDPEAFLNEEGTTSGRHKIPSNQITNASIIIYYFLDETGKVTQFAIICLTNHAAFDGSGIYTCLNKFFEAATQGEIHLPAKKAAPEEQFDTLIDPGIKNADHTEYAKRILDAYMLPMRAHNFSREHPAQEIPFQPSEVRRTLSQEQTARLLSRCKTLGVTISQLAMAANFVPLFRVYPAKSSEDIVAYSIAMNLRNHLKIPSPFYGNAVTGCMDSFRCADISSNVIQGKGALDKEDAQSIYTLAQTLTYNLHHHHQSVASEESVATTQVIDMLLGMIDPKAPPSSIPQGHVSDGVLERYIRRQYTGSTLQFDVEDAYLSLQEPAPMVHGRTSTFRDRLCLAMAFDARSWKKEEVEVLAKGWADALVFVAENAEPAPSTYTNRYVV